MNPAERAALLAAIQHFKGADISDLDAALNCIAHHAKTIRAAADLVGEWRAEASDRGWNAEKRRALYRCAFSLARALGMEEG